MVKNGELKAFLAKNDYTYKNIERILNKSTSYVAQRMAGHKDWSLSDCWALMNWMGEPEREFHLFFPNSNRGLRK